jgi:hypothetical protein
VTGIPHPTARRLAMELVAAGVLGHMRRLQVRACASDAA